MRTHCYLNIHNSLHGKPRMNLKMCYKYELCKLPAGNGAAEAASVKVQRNKATLMSMLTDVVS